MQAIPMTLRGAEKLREELDFLKSVRRPVNSPIARGLIGKEEDDVVVIKTPGGEVEFEVIKVEYL